MFIYDSMMQGLELLAQRELQSAENLFLIVINDPHSQPEETKRARIYSVSYTHLTLPTTPYV